MLALGVDEIDVPYVTVGWIAAVREDTVNPS